MTADTTTEPGERLPIRERAPLSFKALMTVETAIREEGLDPALIELVKARASQINGCAFCIDLHTANARRLGETERRLYLLSTWRDTSLFTSREQAALALTEAVTLVAETHAPDDVWDAAARHFDETELATLLMTIATINAWNRIAVTSRIAPGSFRP